MDEFQIKEWYLWDCRSFSGKFNMLADHLLARQMNKLLDKPLLRFFTWNPYCISLGYHQNSDEIDLQKCEEENIDVVRRPTGGRAILHSEELTYSVVYPFESTDVSTFYRLTHIPFVSALQQYGIPAEFKSSQTDFREFYRSDRSAVCFATSAQYEVEIHGSKLIGSAQRVYENAILQHGSLLLGEHHLRLVDFLKQPTEKRIKMRDYIKKHTAHVWEFSGELRAEELAVEISGSFAKKFSLDFVPFSDNKELGTYLRNEVTENAFEILTHHPGENINAF